MVRKLTDRQLVADEACRDAEEADQRTDDRDNPRVRSDTGLIARANSEEDDNPLPQAEPVAITPTPTDLLEVGVRQSGSPLPRHRPPRRRRQGLQRGADHLPRDITAAFRSFRTAYPMPP